VALPVQPSICARLVAPTLQTTCKGCVLRRRLNVRPAGSEQAVQRHLLALPVRIRDDCGCVCVTGKTSAHCRIAAKPGGEADSEVWRRMKITLLENEESK
jgi:hypothetical protein